MPGAKISEVEKNSFTASLISVLLVNAILGGCGAAPQGGGTPKMRLPLSIMTKTKSIDQVWGPNSTMPFHSLFEFLVPPLLKTAFEKYWRGPQTSRKNRSPQGVRGVRRRTPGVRKLGAPRGG